MNNHQASRANTWCVLILVGAFAIAAPGARAMSSTSQVAETGKAVRAVPGWPDGVLDLVNDPLRTDGWNPWFSGMANDVNFYTFKVRDTDDVNRLIQKLTAIKAQKVRVQLNPASEATYLGYSTVLEKGNGAAVVFSLGNQQVLNDWYQRKKEKLEIKEAPKASPPTLILYAGSAAIDLGRLKIPPVAEVSKNELAARSDSPPDSAVVKAIEDFIANRQSNSDSAASTSPVPKEGSKPEAKQPVTKKVPGRVTDEAGKPLAKVRWRISAFEEWQDDHWELNHDIYTGQQPEFFTDGEGRFELTFSRQVRLDLQFDKSGFAPAFLYQVAPEVGDLQVVLQRGVPVRGSVVLADSGQPVKGQRVVMLRLPTRGWSFQTWTYLSSEGRFEFRVAPPPKEPGRTEPARWQIEYAGQTITIDVREGEPVNVRVKVAASAQKSEFLNRQGSIAWVEHCLEDFESIKVGSSRGGLEQNFKLDGGLQGASPVRFCHPACPYFKVDVEFDFKRYAADQNRAVAEKNDKVLHVSKPYLERPFMD